MKSKILKPLAILSTLVVLLILLLFIFYPRNEAIKLEDYLGQFYNTSDYEEDLAFDIVFEGDLNGRMEFSRVTTFKDDSEVNVSIDTYANNEYTEYAIDFDKTIKGNEEMFVVNSYSGDNDFINFLGENYSLKKILDYGVYAESNFDSTFGYPNLKHIIDELSELEILKEKRVLEVDISEDKEYMTVIMETLLDLHVFDLNSADSFTITIEGIEEIESVRFNFKNVSIQTLTAERIFSGSFNYKISRN